MNTETTCPTSKRALASSSFCAMVASGKDLGSPMAMGCLRMNFTALGLGVCSISAILGMEILTTKTPRHQVKSTWSFLVS